MSTLRCRAFYYTDCTWSAVTVGSISRCIRMSQPVSAMEYSTLALPSRYAALMLPFLLRWFFFRNLFFIHSFVTPYSARSKQRQRRGIRFYPYLLKTVFSSSLCHTTDVTVAFHYIIRLSCDHTFRVGHSRWRSRRSHAWARARLDTNVTIQ